MDVEDQRFSVALIPHTLTIATLGNLQSGDPVNLATDVLAKYVERTPDPVAVLKLAVIWGHWASSLSTMRRGAPISNTCTSPR